MALLYRGYMGMVHSSQQLRLYKIGQACMTFLYFCFMIIDSGAINGFTRSHTLSE